MKNSLLIIAGAVFAFVVIYEIWQKMSTAQGSIVAQTSDVTNPDSGNPYAVRANSALN